MPPSCRQVVDPDNEGDEGEVPDDVFETVEDSLRGDDQFVGGDFSASQQQQQQTGGTNGKCFRRNRPMDSPFI